MLQHVIWHVTYQGLTWRGPRHPKGTGDAVMDSTFYMSVYWGSGMHTLMPPHNSFQGATCECFVITKGGSGSTGFHKSPSYPYRKRL